MVGIDEAIAMDALKQVCEPEINQDLVSLGMVAGLDISGTTVSVRIELAIHASPHRDSIEAEVRKALVGIGANEVEVRFSAAVRGPQKEPLEGVKNIIAIGSGKGGVGKSTVAANLAANLAADGASVGLLDADIYGPSQGKMFAVEGRRLMADDEKRMLPLKAYGVRIISIANLVEDGQALTWRGPILHGTINQMLNQTSWGELDYLLIDLPPGTGDVQLSLSQLVDVTGAVLITTPQDMALLDVRRAYSMFRKTHIPVVGVIENMAYYRLPDGTRDYIFGEGGAQAFADAEGLQLLGQIPISRSIRESGDAGKPFVLIDPKDLKAQVFRDAARMLAGRISAQIAVELPVL
jgi:ATP-binding protein involved in chromosome partitioning